MGRFALMSVAVMFAAVLQSGCGETSQQAQYENGRYAGKPDTPYWKEQAFNGDRAQWEKEIIRRNKLQSEYTRQGGG